LTKTQAFSSYWPELGLIRAEWGQTGEKYGFQMLRVGYRVFYAQLLLINIISYVN